MIKSISTEVVLPDVAINIYKPKDPVEVPVVESRIATLESSPNFVRHITFDVSGTALEGNIRAGQSIGIVPPGTQEDGRPHKLRLYSVSSPSKGEDGQGKLVSTIVKRVVDEHWETQELFTGVCSNYLCSLKPGDKVMMTGPSGKKFILPEHPEEYNYVFFATGTGIAPFRGMVMDLMEMGTKSDVVFIFGSPYRTDLLYNEYFEPLDKKIPNFHYLKSVSREDRRPDGTKPYVQYQIVDNAELLHPILSKDNTLIYVCGLKGMETGIYKLLAEAGLNDYFIASDELKAISPAQWKSDDIKKGTKPSDRMFLEVY